MAAKKKAKSKKSTVTNKESRDEVLKDIRDELRVIHDKLELIATTQARELEQERLIAAEEEAEMKELEHLEQLEEEIKRDLTPHPLSRITYHDITKGIIGAFFGIVGHFAFFYGGRIASELPLWKSHLLLLTSLVMLILFIYFSGFRKVRDIRSTHYIPWRVIVIFITAHIVIIFVLWLFGQISLAMSPELIYQNITAVSILAVMGAATADLIGSAE